MSKYIIRVDMVGRDYSHNYTIEEFHAHPLGKTLKKLFKAGYVNTDNRYKSLEEIHRQCKNEWAGWDEIKFNTSGNFGCKNVFYMHPSHGEKRKGAEYVTLEYMINL